jgi:hypothetical protein
LTQHYYLVASLPLLLFDDPPPFSSTAFLAMCREQLAEDDHVLLARISFDALLPRPGDHDLWRAYSSWETALRDELAVQRAQRLGVSPDLFLRAAPFFVGLPALVKEALGAGTPREVETALDRRRWSYLEEIEAGTQFGLGRLIVYRLKLLLLERKDRFRPEPGRTSFMEGYARVLGDAAAWTSAAGIPIGYGERT